MRFNLLHLFALFLLLFHTQRGSALAFDPVIGPYVKGAQVPLEWTLDGSEPANGWQLWFVAGGSGIKLDNIPPLATSAVVPFPGSGNGTFQGLSGTLVLATSNEVDIATDSTVFATGTATFSASVTSGATSSAGAAASSTGTTAAQTLSPTSASESSAASRSSSVTTNALLGIIVGTLAVIAIIVVASVSLFVHRRRRVAEQRYPFAPSDVEKQLVAKITPFNGESQPHSSSPPLPPPLPSRPSSRPSSGSPPTSSLPPPGSLPSSSSDSRRQAYLNSQLQRLDVQQRPDSASIVFGPLSSVPSEYLSEQMDRLAGVNRRRPSTDASVVLNRLSSVPSESTAQPYVRTHEDAISTVASTVGNSPIQFRRGPVSPITPVTRVAPW
ncbi:hypothetical protein B0H17DRAFT_1092422 [Mycena rosella]|uniref:Uncharacterized protein n=1 Tax=Mycena rosella TaxID=1033263 RepID=A0AAD7CU90_MYCRO|nr:hypothetical protein B0H17DRAFT_1092422 [Mycena rosella]